MNRTCTLDDSNKCHLIFGQHLTLYELGPHKVNELNGIGLQIQFDKALQSTIVYEGQFKNNKLNGWGRKMTYNFSEEKACTTSPIGYWQDNVRHGFMQMIDNNGEKESNLYENDERREKDKIDEILDYDHRYNKIAKNIDYN